MYFNVYLGESWYAGELDALVFNSVEVICLAQGSIL